MKHRVYWWTGGDWFSEYQTPSNFGDAITPIILDYFNVDYEYVSDDTFNMLCIGSHISLAKNNTIVLGSGIKQITDYINPYAKYYFVRGPITKGLIEQKGKNCPEIYGDAAVLLPLIRNSSIKKHEYGIVPHWTQYENTKTLYPNENVINPVTDCVNNVIDKITECRYILSSSLHGIIVANAFDIPTAWVDLGKIERDDDSKFKDYFYSIGIKPIKSTVKDPVFQKCKMNNLNPLIDIFKSL